MRFPWNLFFSTLHKLSSFIDPLQERWFSPLIFLAFSGHTHNSTTSCAGHHMPDGASGAEQRGTVTSLTFLAIPLWMWPNPLLYSRPSATDPCPAFCPLLTAWACPSPVLSFCSVGSTWAVQMNSAILYLCNFRYFTEGAYFSSKKIIQYVLSCFPTIRHFIPRRLTFCGQAVGKATWVLMQW